MAQSKINISVLDLSVLMYNVYHSVPIIDYNDSSMALEQLMHEVNDRVDVRVELIEKLLYCSNLLDEKEKFWHYRNKRFDAFLKEQTWPEYDKGRNYFKGYIR